MLHILYFYYFIQSFGALFLLYVFIITAGYSACVFHLFVHNLEYYNQKLHVLRILIPDYKAKL